MPRAQTTKPCFVVWAPFMRVVAIDIGDSRGGSDRTPSTGN